MHIGIHDVEGFEIDASSGIKLILNIPLQEYSPCVIFKSHKTNHYSRE